MKLSAILPHMPCDTRCSAEIREISERTILSCLVLSVYSFVSRFRLRVWATKAVSAFLSSAKLAPLIFFKALSMSYICRSYLFASRWARFSSVSIFLNPFTSPSASAFFFNSISFLMRSFNSSSSRFASSLLRVTFTFACSCTLMCVSFSGRYNAMEAAERTRDQLYLHLISFHNKSDCIVFSAL